MKTQTLTLALALLIIPAVANADTAKFDAAMKPLLKPYYKIQLALAGDTEKGVKAAGKELAKAAGKIKAVAKKVKGKHAKHYKGLPDKIQQAAKKVAAAKGIEARRAAFRELSKPMAMWASMSKPKDLNVVYCSCGKGGSWLQAEKVLANPYYGAKMLKCGKIISGKDKGHKDGHGHAH